MFDCCNITMYVDTLCTITLPYTFSIYDFRQKSVTKMYRDNTYHNFLLCVAGRAVFINL